MILLLILYSGHDSANYTYYVLYSSWFLNTNSFDHLKYVYHTLGLTELDGIHQSTKYTGTTHCVATVSCKYSVYLQADLQDTILVLIIN